MLMMIHGLKTDQFIKQWLALIVLLIAVKSAHGNDIIAENTITLDGKGQQPASLFVQSLLEKAYSNLGYRVEYLTMPLGRSWLEANDGVLDGLRARVEDEAKKYPNLIKVPFPLFSFDLLLITSDLKCQPCEVTNIDTLAYVRGMAAFQRIVNPASQDHEFIEVTSTSQALALLEQRRVDGVILPDLMLPASTKNTIPDSRIQVLMSLYDYHFLHVRHQALVPKIQAELDRLEKNGFVSKLRDLYGMKSKLAD